MAQKASYTRVRADALAVLPPEKETNAAQVSYSVEIPKQMIVLLFFALLFSFLFHAWRESRFFGSDELLALLIVRAGAGLLFWWLEIDD